MACSKKSSDPNYFVQTNQRGQCIKLHRSYLENCEIHESTLNGQKNRHAENKSSPSGHCKRPHKTEYILHEKRCRV